MKMTWPFVVVGLMAAASFATVRSCKYYWNPHYLGNKAVYVDSVYYSPDSSAALVSYTLDIGARGYARYQTLLKKTDFQHDLSQFLLPAEYTAPKWKGNDTLEVVFDEYAGYKIAGPQTKIDLGSDITTQNGVTIIVVERRMNKRKMLRRGMREIDAGG